MFYQQNKPLGITFIVLGAFAILIAIAPLLLPLLLVFAGLYLLNLGLRLCGKPPITITIYRIWATRSWRW